MQPVTLNTEELRKLLSCGCPDAVALYLYRRSAQPLETAADALHFTVPQIVAATECLRQLGLWDTPERPPLQPERYARAVHADDRKRGLSLGGRQH